MSGRPWPLGSPPSAGNDPLDAVVAAVAAHYAAGAQRCDLRAAEELLARLTPPRSAHRVVVVGTNGKSSTTTYLARLLTTAGRRTGSYTSPHLERWDQRIQVDLVPVGAQRFAEALQGAHAAAAGADGAVGDGLGFFDVLTFAAELVFGAAGVEYGIFEAGIGGRLDATRCLAAPLVLLTNNGEDHEALLGADPVQRLREKALVTPRGGTLLASALPVVLEAELRRIGAAAGFDIEIAAADPGPPPPGLPRYQAANLALARAAARRLGVGDDVVVTPGIDGRFDMGMVDGVAYAADVAHNPTAWRAFLDDLPAVPHVMVCAITEPRDPGPLVAALLGARGKVAHVVVTGTTVRSTQDPGSIAAALVSAGVEAIALALPTAAFAAAVAAARTSARPLAVFGSNYLVADFLAWVGDRPGWPLAAPI